MGLLTAIKNFFNPPPAGGVVPDPETPSHDGYGAAINDPTIMTPKEVVSDHFVQHKVSFKEILNPKETAVVKWDYLPNMTKDQIEDIIPHCGCTANITWGDVGVQATYTHDERSVPPGGGFYTKTMTVYFKDGYGKVSDGRGGMMYDPKKKRRVLSFTGKLMP